SDVAIYNFIISTTFLIEFLQNGLTNAIYPKIFDLWTRDKINSNSKEVNKYFNAYTGISLLIIPLFVLIIPIIVPVFVLNTDFLQGFTFLLLISVAFTFRGIQNIYFTSIMYLKKTKRIAKINLYTSIIQIVVSVVLIKQFGLSGAFWAFMVVKPVQTLIFYLEIKKLFKYNMNYTKQVFIPLVYVALAIILYPFYFTFNIHILNLIQLTVIWTITFLVYKNEIINLIRYFFLKKHSLTNVKS
ncbi:MAG: polysaccharide biosynthesis C-terminal domain-containing protein, partial [Bacteroidales bacterium]|nr:polysaccharide biosynthesis C-terminal domain-containing protein [Bacteroidales bacterium]